MSRIGFGGLLTCSLLAACGGGSDLDPGAGNSAGTGTSTLLVDGDIEARPRIDNAQRAGDFDTHLSVRVTLNGQPVTTGTLTVSSRSASKGLVYDGATSKWDATVPGYDEVYVVDVEAGADYVEGVRVDGPDLHYFTAPTAGATVDSTVATQITWKAEQEATTARIDAEEIDKITIPDAGQYLLAAGALKADQDTPRENIIDLTRSNRVSPAGAVGGSELRVSVTNRIQVIAQPNPAL